MFAALPEMKTIVFFEGKRMAWCCQETAIVGPHLFPPPRDAGEDQGGGLNDVNE
jgi:hypothetical protein